MNNFYLRTYFNIIKIQQNLNLNYKSTITSIKMKQITLKFIKCIINNQVFNILREQTGIQDYFWQSICFLFSQINYIIHFIVIYFYILSLLVCKQFMIQKNILTGLKSRALNSRNIRQQNSLNLLKLPKLPNFIFHQNYANRVPIHHINYFSFSSTSLKSDTILLQLAKIKQAVGQKDVSYLKKINQLGLAYTDENNIEKALEAYKDLISRLRVSLNDPQLLSSFLKAVQILLCRTGKLQESIKYLEQFIQLIEKQKGQNSLQILKQYKLLGQICFKSHKIENAIKYFQKVLQILKNHIEDNEQKNINPDKNKNQKIEIMFNIATCNWSIGKKQEALQYFTGVKQLLITLKPLNTELLTHVIMNISILHQLKNSFDQSLKQCQQLEVILNQGQNSKTKASLFNQMGKLYLKKRKFEPCQKYLIESLNILLAQTPQNNSKLVQTYQILANLYQTKEDMPRAVQNYQKLLELTKSIAKQGNQYFIANISNTVGNLFLMMKQFEQARNHFLQSQKLLLILKNKKPEDSYPNQTLGDTYYNIGKTFHDETKFKQAVEWYQKGKSFYEITKDLSNKIKLINVYRGLGLTYFNGPKDKQKTIENLSKSAKLCQQSYPNHPDLKMQYALIFDSFYGLNKLQQALAYTQKILKINQHELKQNPNNMESFLGVAFQNYFVGLIKYKLNNFNQAKTSLLSAEEQFKNIFTNNKNNMHQNMIYTSILLEQLYRLENNILQAQNQAKKVQTHTKSAFQKMKVTQNTEIKVSKFIKGAKQFLLNSNSKKSENTV